MIRAIWARAQHGDRTIQFPKGAPVLPDRLRGRPELDPSKCAEGCKACAEACPTGAIALGAGTAAKPRLELDLGKCLFCTDCTEACPEGALNFTTDYRLATRKRDDLLVNAKTLQLARALDKKMKSLFGRSLKLRQVSAGGCNGCEVDVNVLTTIVFDLSRFGIEFVASPRHADGLLITGPVTENMKLALEKTWAALPEPKLVIASGACAISGGPYIGSPEIHHGASSVVPVDLFIPGCPPHPITTLDGLLRLLGRIEKF